MAFSAEWRALLGSRLPGNTQRTVLFTATPLVVGSREREGCALGAKQALGG